MKHTKSKSGINSNATAASPSKGKGDRGKGKGSVDSNGSGSNKLGIKDKERRESLSMGPDKELRGDSIDLKDCPLRLPEFANVDHGKLVPRYTSGTATILGRSLVWEVVAIFDPKFNILIT